MHTIIPDGCVFTKTVKEKWATKKHLHLQGSKWKNRAHNMEFHNKDKFLTTHPFHNKGASCTYV
jgi:hypothetical protein